MLCVFIGETCICDWTCTSDDTMNVCGTDGRTYRSKCHLDKASCESQQPISVAMTGSCTGEQSGSGYSIGECSGISTSAALCGLV